MTTHREISALLAFACCLASCEKKQEPAGPPASASVASAVPSAKPPEKPWFVGSWRAPLEVERYQIEQTKQEGKIKAWAEDSGEKSTGSGELLLQIEGSGAVTGKLTGALGNLDASGMLEGETLRVRLQSSEQTNPAERFNGVLLAEKSDGGFQGELKASSGDSLTVRKASVVLAKQGADGAQPAGKGK